MEAYLEIMEAVRDDILEDQKAELNRHIINMDHTNLYGEGYHHLFPRLVTQTNTIFPFFKSFYSSIQEKEVVPCIFVDVDKQAHERSYFKFEALKSCLIIEEEMSQKKLDDMMNLLMKLRCPMALFR